MNYLELTAGQLACQFIKKPDSLFEAFEQLFSTFECFRLGDESITGGDEGTEDFFQYCPLELLEDIEKAMQHVRRHCDMINRFCEDIDKGRGPSMKDGIRLISLVDRGKKPTKSMMEEWHNWDSELRDYVEFFKESLLIDYLYSEEGYKDRGETKPGQQSDTVAKEELRARCREFVLVAKEIIARLEETTEGDWWNDQSLEVLSERLNFSRQGTWLEILPNEFEDHILAFGVLTARAGDVAPTEASPYRGSVLLERWFEGPRDEDITVIVVSDPYICSKQEWQIRASIPLPLNHLKQCRLICLRHLRSWVRAVGEQLEQLDSEHSVPRGSPAVSPNGNLLTQEASEQHDSVDGIPVWIADTRTLKLKSKTVRQYAAQVGKDVLDILNSFQECEWKSRIDDPISPPASDKTKLALRTINLNLTGLRFSKDGDGIKWELIPNSL